MQYKASVLAQKNFFSYILASICLFIISLSFTFLAHATTTPTLYLTGTGDNDTVQVNVTGDPNESVILYYQKSGVGSQLSVIGTTNSNGTLSTTVSSSAYGILTNTPVHVTVNGVSGPASTIMYWPTVSSVISSTAFSLNQNAVVVTVGQSSTVTASNIGTTPVYVSNNSNPSIANVNINGAQISITGNVTGNTVITICMVGNTSNCQNINTTVQAAGASTLSFSQNSLTLSSGQTIPITVSGGNGIYTVTNNTNSSIIATSINGSVISLNALGITGTASLTVCSSDMSACGIINATLGTANTSTLSFTQTNPIVTVGQSTTVTIYGGVSGTAYYVSANSNSNIAQATINGTVLTITGVTAGTTNITVCSSVSSCGVVSVTVNYLVSGGTIALSQTSLTILTNQTLSITISGGSMPYSLTTYSGPNYQANINGNILSVTGIAAGSAQIAVCSAAGGCTWLNLTVNSGTYTSGSSPILSQTSLSIVQNQTSTVAITGNGGYYVSLNTNPNVATGAISGNSIAVSSLNPGTTTITICQTGGQCSALYVTTTAISSTTTTPASTGGTFLSFSQTNPMLSIAQGTTISVSGDSTNQYKVVYNSNPNALTAAMVNGMLILAGQNNGTATVVVCSTYNYLCGATGVTVGNGVSTTAPATANTSIPASTTGSTTDTTTNTTSLTYTFSNNLIPGDSGTEVTKLQQKLKTLGFYTGPVNGRLGPLTETAVKKFQKAHSISQTGNVGPSTRNALNQ